jgi:hypothetical protein
MISVTPVVGAFKVPKGNGSGSGSGSAVPSPNEVIINAILGKLNRLIFKEPKTSWFSSKPKNVVVPLSLQQAINEQKKLFMDTIKDNQTIQFYIPSINKEEKNQLSSEDVFTICSNQIHKLFTEGFVKVSDDDKEDIVNAMTFLHSRYHDTVMGEELHIYLLIICMSYLLTLANGIIYTTEVHQKSYANRFFSFYVYDNYKQRIRNPYNEKEPIKNIQYWKDEESAKAMKKKLIDHFATNVVKDIKPGLGQVESVNESKEEDFTEDQKKFKDFFVANKVQIIEEMNKLQDTDYTLIQEELLNFVRVLEIRQKEKNKYYIYTGYSIYTLTSDNVKTEEKIIFYVLSQYYLNYSMANDEGKTKDEDGPFMGQKQFTAADVGPLYIMLFEPDDASNEVRTPSKTKGGRKSRKGRKSRARKTRRKRGKRSRKYRKR